MVASLWWESAAAKERLGRRKANAALALVRFEKCDSIRSTLQEGEDPDARSFFIDRAARFDVDPDRLVAELEKETDPNIQSALILALGQFSRDAFSKEEVEKIVSTLLAIYSDSPDPGLHGACPVAASSMGAALKTPTGSVVAGHRQDRRKPSLVH